MQTIVELPEFLKYALGLLNEMNLHNSPVFYVSIMVTMMANAFSSIKQGLAEAIEFSEGKSSKAVVHELGPLDVKKMTLRHSTLCHRARPAAQPPTRRHCQERNGVAIHLIVLHANALLDGSLALASISQVKLICWLPNGIVRP
ncbi:hypothetical protein [Halopseudomonas salegens]|uniref:Uncharacterized protein n=1 Tax=Halopseudomonas salegens TaxID=1434072 RepID=A0A1H2FMP2_9GAMM|nr:hypothetical protein [Halopseudomonas salegens]SDU08592.1 hypothetical protein SAMN05216210_1672 [Halopseudomonas salegens]